MRSRPPGITPNNDKLTSLHLIDLAGITRAEKGKKNTPITNKPASPTCILWEFTRMEYVTCSLCMIVMHAIFRVVGETSVLLRKKISSIEGGYTELGP